MIARPTKSNEAQASAREIFALAAEERRELRKVRAKSAHAASTITRARVCLVLLAVSAPMLIASVLINVVGVSVTALFETPPAPAVAREEAQRTLDALVLDIETFNKHYNELPESLTEIGVPSRGTWTYAPVGKTSYRIHGALYGQHVSFDAAAAASRPVKDHE
jgi:hypothetical protein